MDIGSAEYGRRVKIDFEIKSYADLKKVGTWAYSEHPTTEVICLSYGIDDGPIKTWIPRKIADEAGWGHEYCTPDDRMPNDLYMAIILGALVECHNCAFEYSIWVNIMVAQFGWTKILDHQWRDSMAAACYLALPAALDRLASALGYEGKDPGGSKLITKYSKLHNKTAKAIIPAEDLKRWIAYCERDVRIEQSAGDYLGDLPEAELEIWQMNQEINRRGMLLDLKGIAAAEATVEKRARELEEKFLALTGGVTPRQNAKLLAWFQANGLPDLENLRAETLEALIDPEEPDCLGQGPAREAITMRLKINKASTKKLDAMARQVGSDGRARFQTRYHGAATGRDTGSGFQPLNLNRGFDEEKTGVTPEQLVKNIMLGDPRWLDCLYGDAMDAVAKASRHWIMASPGCRIMSGDFSSIEAVGLACLSGEQWKIDAFAQGVGIYELMACKIYNLDPALALDKKAFKANHGEKRQDGKTAELAFGYMGALNAWLNFDSSGRHTDEKIIEMCKSWRREHPMVVNMWYGLERSAIDAVDHPGYLVTYRDIGFQVKDEWLAMILPDGKHIWYYKPQLRVKMPKWHQPLIEEKCANGTCNHKPKPVLTYMAMKFGQWIRIETYGGKLMENADQATCRQILKPAMLRLREAGYPIILDVYDEVVGDVPIGFGSTEEFGEIMKIRPAFAAHWPINCDVWEGQRYKK